MHFDEVYHARTATEFLQGWRYGIDHDIYEWTHPHLAKYLMAGGIVLWGQDSRQRHERPRRAGRRVRRRAAPRRPGGRASGRANDSTSRPARRSEPTTSGPGSSSASIAAPGATALAMSGPAPSSSSATTTAVSRPSTSSRWARAGSTSASRRRTCGPGRRRRRVDQLLALDDATTLLVGSGDHLSVVDVDSGDVTGGLDLPAARRPRPGRDRAPRSSRPRPTSRTRRPSRPRWPDLIGGDAGAIEAKLRETADTVVLGQSGRRGDQDEGRRRHHERRPARDRGHGRHPGGDRDGRRRHVRRPGDGGRHRDDPRGRRRPRARPGHRDRRPAASTRRSGTADEPEVRRHRRRWRPGQGRTDVRRHATPCPARAPRSSTTGRPSRSTSSASPRVPRRPVHGPSTSSSRTATRSTPTPACRMASRPTSWVGDLEPEYPADDRQQLLLFTAGRRVGVHRRRLARVRVAVPGGHRRGAHRGPAVPADPDPVQAPGRGRPRRPARPGRRDVLRPVAHRDERRVRGLLHHRGLHAVRGRLDGLVARVAGRSGCRCP